MDPLAVVLLRRTAKVAVRASGTVSDGNAWAGTLEADLATRGWLLPAR